jgi:hypothetical protein
MAGWHTPTDFVAGTVVTEAMLDDLSALLTTGVMRPIAEVVLASPSATIDFTSIPATFRCLVVELLVRGDVVGDHTDVQLRFNNDSNANYVYERVITAGTTLTASEQIGPGTFFSLGEMACSLSPAGAVGAYSVRIPMYAQTALHKGMLSYATARHLATTGNTKLNQCGGQWLSTAAINRITFTPAASNFNTGSIAVLYGLPMLG